MAGRINPHVNTEFLLRLAMGRCVHGRAAGGLYFRWKATRTMHGTSGTVSDVIHGRQRAPRGMGTSSWPAGCFPLPSFPIAAPSLFAPRHATPRRTTRHHAAGRPTPSCFPLPSPPAPRFEVPALLYQGVKGQGCHYSVVAFRSQPA